MPRRSPAPPRAAFAGALLALAGCREAPPTPGDAAPPPPSSARLVPSIVRPPAATPRPTPSALVELRARQLSLDPALAPARHLAFAGDRLAVLTSAAVVVLEPADGRQVTRLAVAGPRAIVGSVDGGFVVLAEGGTLRLEPPSLAARRFGRVTLFADSEVWADRRDPATIWVHHRGEATLYRYALEEEAPARPVLAPAAEFDLPDFDGHSVLGLKDGSFAYTAGTRVVRLHPGGRSRSSLLPDGASSPRRLLPALRLDEVWVQATTPRLERWRLDPHALRVGALALAAEPFVVSTSDHAVASVQVTRDGDGARAWSLAVWETTGAARFTAPLPVEPVPSGDDWVARAIADRELALPRASTWVAVGGPTSVAVWDARTGLLTVPPERGAALLAAGTTPAGAADAAPP